MKVWRIVRANEWWGSKVPMLLGLYFFLSPFYDGKLTFWDVALGALILLWWMVSAAAFGYLINNIFDLEQDLKAGKTNLTQGLSIAHKWILSLLLGLASFLPWMVGYRQQYMIMLCAVHLCLFLLYSIPPVRLKERGYIGVVTDALYAFVIPVVIVSHFAIQDYDHPTVFELPVIVWSFLAGLRSILLHHIKDRKADSISHMGNVINKYGISTNALLINAILLPFEILAFVFLLYYHEKGRWLIAGFTLYLIMMCFSMTRYGLQWSLSRKVKSLRYAPSLFYEGWFLLLVLSIDAIGDPLYWILVVLQLVLFQNEVFHFAVKLSIRLWYGLVTVAYFLGSVLMKLFYFIRSIFIELGYRSFSLSIQLYHALKRLFKPLVVNTWHHAIRPVLSAVVNYSIYYTRRLILQQTNEEASKPLTIWSKVVPVKAENHKNSSELEIGSRFSTDGDKEARTGSHNVSEIPAPRVFRRASEVRDLSPIITSDNKTVNGLWIGNYLSNIEILTIQSFLAAGHTFKLWVYEPVSNVPKGVNVCNANDIIPAAQIFRYKYANAYGHGKGSVSGFSDIFRYKLLYDNGGWWVDMDICCLHPLKFNTPYFFRKHHDLDLVGNMMKCPKGSQLMWDCYTEAKETINENNTDWHKPIEILNRHVVQLGLSDFIFTGFSNQDKWEEIRQFIQREGELDPDYVALHWMNEEWRSRGLNKNDIRYNSTLGKLMAQYGIIARPDKKAELWLNDLRHLLWLPFYERIQAR